MTIKRLRKVIMSTPMIKFNKIVNFVIHAQQQQLMFMTLSRLLDFIKAKRFGL